MFPMGTVPAEHAELHDLITLTAEALHERAAYIVENARTIYVSVQIGERRENYPLSELRGAMAISEAFRLLLRAEVTVRRVVTVHRVGDADPAAGEG
jgi:hypothetical protein